MRDRLRVLLALTRPAALILFVLVALTGLATHGAEQRLAQLVPVLVAVVGFVLAAVAVNDLADVDVDAVNVPDRPLVTGAADRRQMRTVAGVAAGAAVAAGAWLGPAGLLVVVVGLGVAVAYSVYPVRLADRGVVAALVLPACYVAVPFLLGAWSDGVMADVRTWLLLAGLYVGLTGRLVLKDFRDVRGDALFGKRTFLVRHGRRATCAFAAGGLITGALLVAAATPDAAAPVLVLAAASAGLVLALARTERPRTEESLISGIAVLGRMTIVAVLAELAMSGRGWPGWAQLGALAALTLIGLGQAAVLVVAGPRARLRMPYSVKPMAKAASRS